MFGFGAGFKIVIRNGYFTLATAVKADGVTSEVVDGCRVSSQPCALPFGPFAESICFSLIYLLIADLLQVLKP